MKHPTHNTSHTQKGFTLLFAVLVSTLVVSIGATIISIAVRQTILSGTSRESQYAFYAANTILDCAHYWDIIGTGLSETDSGIVFPSEGFNEVRTTVGDITCAGINIRTGKGGENGEDQITREWDISQDNITTFEIEISDKANVVGEVEFTHKYCAQATVSKEDRDPNNDGTPDSVLTTIEAKGYNTACSDTDNPRRVERGLIQQYES